MAEFDPASLGAVAVEEEFDPASLGAEPIEEFDPSSLGAVPVEKPDTLSDDWTGFIANTQIAGNRMLQGITASRLNAVAKTQKSAQLARQAADLGTPEAFDAYAADQQEVFGPAGFPSRDPEKIKKTADILERRWRDESLKIPEFANYLAQKEKRIQELTPSLSPEMQKFNEAKGAEFWKTFAANPVESLANVIASSAIVSAPAIAAGAVGSLAGPAGTAAATAAGSYSVETSQAILDALKSADVDIANPEQVEAAFTDPSVMEKARDFANKRGVPIAIFDAATAGIAGKFIGPVLKEVVTPTTKAVLAATGKEVLTQAAGGAAGEFTAQVAAGQEISLKDIALEALGEIGTGVTEVSGNIRARNKVDAELAKIGTSEPPPLSTPSEPIKTIPTPQETQPTTTPDAITNPETAPVYGDVRQEPGEVPQQVPAEEGGERVPSSGQTQPPVQEEKVSPHPPQTTGESIVSTGILGEDGKPLVGQQWNSPHADIIKQNPELALIDDIENRKGFIIQDANGRQIFVGRKQALGVGQKAGQVDLEKVYDPEGHGLISEALVPIENVPRGTQEQAAQALQPFLSQAVDAARQAGAIDPESAASQAQIELSQQVSEGTTKLDNPQAIFLEAARRQARKQQEKEGAQKRGGKVTEPIETAPEPSVTRGPRADIVSEEDIQSIDAKIDTLPEQQKKVMRALVDSPDLTDLQLAEATGMTEGAAKQAKARARQTLREFIAQQGIGQQLGPGASNIRELQRARYTLAADIYEGLRQAKQLDRATWEKNMLREYGDIFDKSDLDTAWAVAQEASEQFTESKGRKPMGKIIDQLTGAKAGEGITSIKNKQADLERRKRGLPAAMQVARRTHLSVWDEAMRMMEENPQLQDETVNKYRDNPVESATDTETAILLHRQIELENAYDSAVDEVNSAYDKGDDQAKLEAIHKAKTAEEKLIDIYDINKQVGTAQGRGLSARRMLAGRDYTLARMVAETRASKGGVELTDSERSKLEEQFNNIKKTQEDLEARIKKLEEDNARTTAEETVSEMRKTTKTGKPSKKESSDAIASLKKKLEARLKDGEPITDLRSYIQRLSLELVRGGLDQLNPLVDVVHAFVEPMVPGITKRNVMDLISGYGDSKALDQEKAKATLRDIKGQAQQVAKLEDIIAKRPILKTGVERRTPSDAERRLIREVNLAKKKYGVVVTDPAKQLKSTLDSIKTRVSNEIRDLTHQIETGEQPSPGLPAPTSEEIERLKAIRARLRETLKDIDGKPEITDEQRVIVTERALESSIKGYEDQLKGLDTKKEKKTISTPRIDALRAKRDALKAELEALRAADQNLQDTKTFDRLMKSADELQAKLERGEVRPDTKAAKIEDELVTQAREHLQKLRDQIQQARNATPEAQKAKMDAAIASVQRSIDSYDAKLKAGDIATKPGTKVTSPILERLRAERDAMRKLVEQLRKPAALDPETLALKMLKARLARANADIQDRISRGDFSKKTRRELDISKDAEAVRLRAENEKWKREFENRKMENERATETGLRKALRIGKEVLNVPRAIKSSIDFSAVLRQGGFIAFGNPVRAAKNLIPMFRAGFSQESFNRSEAEIRSRPNAPLYKSSKLYLASLEGALDGREEAFRSELADRIPGVKMSNRAYITFLNRIRADSFDAMVGSLTTSPTQEQLKAIAHFINVSTGRGDLGTHGSAAETLSTVLWSPRLLISRFQLLAGEPLLRGNAAGVRKVIAKEYAKAFAGLSVVMALGALAGADIEKDPRSSDYLKLKFGNTRIDPWMGLQQISVLGSRLISGETKTQKGQFLSLRKTDDKKRPPWAETGADVIARFLRTKLTPLLGTGIDLASGENVVGEKATALNAAGGLVTPLSFGDILPLMEEQGIPKGTALQILNLFGMSVQHYQDQKK